MSFWTDEKIESLKSLWAEGNSAASIRNQIGAPSRNAVLAKLNRLGLLGGRRGVTKPRQADRVVNLKSAKPYVSAPPVAEPEPLTLEGGVQVTLMTAGVLHCRWPKWGDQEHEHFQVCGHRKAPDSPYCPFHTKRAAGSGTHGERSAA